MEDIWFKVESRPIPLCVDAGEIYTSTSEMPFQQFFFQPNVPKFEWIYRTSDFVRHNPTPGQIGYHWFTDTKLTLLLTVYTNKQKSAIWTHRCVSVLLHLLLLLISCISMIHSWVKFLLICLEIKSKGYKLKDGKVDDHFLHLQRCACCLR